MSNCSSNKDIKELAIEILKENRYSNDMNEDVACMLASNSNIITLSKDEFLFVEGDSSDYFYIIVSGEVQVVKKSPETDEFYEIAVIKKGDLIGGLELLDNLPRSASIKSIGDSILLAIPSAYIREMATTNLEISKFAINISRDMNMHFRETNELVTKNIARALQESHVRSMTGNLMISIVALLTLFTFLLNVIQNLRQNDEMAILIAVPMTVVMLTVSVLTMLSFGFPLKTFGITFVGWRKALKDGFVIGAIFCFIIIAVKFILIKYVPSLHNGQLFHISSYHLMSHIKQERFILDILIYGFFVIPSQEFIARSCLQAPMEIALTGRRIKLKSIVFSNLMFSMTHLYVGYIPAFIAFIYGLLWGWLFSKHKNLVGCTVCHIIVGVGVLKIIGISLVGWS